jgi:hypothetical protein
LPAWKQVQSVCRRFDRPTGQFVEPLGEVSFDQMKAAFHEQAEALVTAGLI